MHILHLSDLHFGNSDDARTWYNQLAEDLIRELNCQRLDAVILSGDIANHSTEEEYNAAKMFLDELCKEFSVQPSRLVIVPGNHDLSWVLAGEAYKPIPTIQYAWEWVKEIFRRVLRRQQGIVERYILDKELYKRRFAHFSSFYEAFVGEPYPEEYEQQYKLHYFPEIGLLILCLNSAWELDHRNTSRVGINPVAISSALGELRRHPEYDSLLKIAVWHHPIRSPFEDRIKDADFMEQLAKAGFGFALHGHIHKAERDDFRYDHSPKGRKIEIISAGTFGAPTRELVPGYPWQYNLLRLDGSTLRVETRRREKINGAWKPDAQWVGDDTRYPLPFYEIEIPTATLIPPGEMSKPPEAKPGMALTMYLNYVLDETRDADYRGLGRPGDARGLTTLPLDEVFVLPRLLSQQASAKSHAQQEKLLRDIVDNEATTTEHQIKLEEEYAALVDEQWRPSSSLGTEEVSVGKFIEQARHAVIIGDPGSGKSSLSRFIARMFALGDRAMLSRLGLSEPLVPILIRVADFADARSERPHLQLVEYVSEKMKDLGGEVLRRVIIDKLGNGSAFIILEGVDEVPGYGERVSVVRAVDKFISDYRKNRFLITSRPAGYLPLGGEIPHFRLLNFSYDQIREYVTRWHYALERKENRTTPNFVRANREASETFYQITSNREVFQLSTNPLLLTLILLIRRQGVRLPIWRVQLYKLAVDVLTEMWNAWRLDSERVTETRLPNEQLIRVWAAVAEWSRRTRPTGVLHRAALKREIAHILAAKELDKECSGELIDDYLEAAAKRIGLLEERAPDIFAFWHRSFEEYLAAVELATPPSDALERLLPLRDDPRWRDVILLSVSYIGIIGRDAENAARLIEAFADRDNDPFWEPLTYPHLRLAAACVADAPGVKQPTVEGIILRLANAIDALPYTHLVRSFIDTVRALPELRLMPEAVEAIQTLVIHPDESVRMQVARLFANVAAENPIARDWCSVMFDDPYYEVQYRAALGLMRAGDHRPAVWRVILRHGFEMREVEAELWHYLLNGDERAVEALRPFLDSQDIEIRFRAARLLIEMNRVDEAAVRTLINSLEARDVFERKICDRLLTLLIPRDKSILDEIYDRLTDAPYALRLGAVRFLQGIGHGGDPRVVAALFSCLEAEDLEVRWEASKMLYDLGYRESSILDATASCLISDSVTLRGAASETLLQMNYALDLVIESQLWCLSQSDPINSAQRLLRMGKERAKVIAALILRLQDEKLNVRCEAAELLLKNGEKFDDSIIALQSCLLSDNPYLRFHAAWVLIDYGRSEGVVELMVKKLAGQHPFFKEEAKSFLGSILEHAKISEAQLEVILLPLLVDEDPLVRSTSAELLLERGLAPERALETLVKLITGKAEAVLAACRRLLYRQPPEPEDGSSILETVLPVEDELLARKHSRDVLYNWLWGLQLTVGTPESDHS